ncbi:unnamed protein product [Phaedon cochleariae]|uniref:Acyl-coenzyme A thioesterase 13 n=1 Tax=Phaedon cochleariae TaxID=80249 RepID=A0A9P0GWU0_PHACE|nr:unnamed protein product [Phaedon cochleariae]
MARKIVNAALLLSGGEPILTVEHLHRHLRNSKGYDKTLNKLIITHLADGNCTAELKIEEEHTNPMGTMHGGLVTSLVDAVSTWGLFTHKNGRHTSVTVELNTTFIQGAKMGEVIEITSNTTRAGKTLAFLDVSVRNKTTKALLVKASHIKYIIESKI